MTRLFLILFGLTGASFSLHAQNVGNLAALQPADDYENVHVQKISDGEEATSFVIWIKQEVKPHYHGVHAEHIYILGGTATMQLGNDTLTVQAGDFVRIPPQTVHAVTVTSTEPLKVLSIQTPQFLGEDRHWVEQ